MGTREYKKADQPTFYFIGVTTGKSSIMKVFPEWAKFLGLGDEISVLQPIIDQYRPDQGSSQQKGTHFVKGKIGRYRQKLTHQQQQLCQEVFGDYLERMGYPLDQETENDIES